MRALNRKLLRDLLHLRGQIVAVLLVVAAGIAVFVTLRSMHAYLLSTRDGYYRDFRFAHVFASAKRAPEPLAARIAELPGVAGVRTRIVRDVTLDVPGLPEPATGRLVSAPPTRERMLNGVYLRRGRWLAAGSQSEVVASEAFAKANHLAPGDSLAALLNGRWEQLHVVGIGLSPEYVYEIRGGEILPDNRRFGVMWMGREALAGAFDMEGAFDDVSVELSPGARPERVVDALDRLLARYGGIGAYGREDQVSHRFLTDEIAETRSTSVVIPAIFLAVTAFLLHLVLSRLVGQQREEIGTLKAIGYSNASIGRHFLAMALLPALAGGTVGVGLGLWLASRLAATYARFFQFPVLLYRPELSIVLVALTIGCGAALAGAFGAVRRAVALPPAEAMRPAIPPAYGPGLVERLRLRRRLSPGARIVIRNLERRPGKAILAIAGLSLAAAVVVVGRYMFDALEFMKELEFAHVHREHVIVSFKEPVGDAALYEVARLPGVRRAEPVRWVPVRLGKGSAAIRTALQGLEPDAELFRVVDRRLRTHRVREDGLLLTRELNRRLGARPGDRLRMELLEGRRDTIEVRVAGEVDELLGMSAYMDRRSVARLTGEAGRISGAFLSVDPSRREALYARLKALPGVSGVTVMSAMRESFERTIAESFRTSLVVLVLFACIIASGIVYNSARVALSERGRELASLRVLGLSRAEVARMLLQEQGLLILLAIPLGLLTGFGLCALLAAKFTSELYRIPLVVRSGTYGFAILVVGAAAVVSSVLVRRRVYRLDLIAVLKTRE